MVVAGYPLNWAEAVAIAAAAGTPPTYSTFGSVTRSLNPSDFGGSPNIYLEVHMKTSASTGYARLYNVTDASEVANTEVSTASTSTVRVRNGTAGALASGDKVYRVEFGAVTGTATVTMYDAIIIIDAS